MNRIKNFSAGCSLLALLLVFASLPAEAKQRHPKQKQQNSKSSKASKSAKSSKNTKAAKPAPRAASKGTTHLQRSDTTIRSATLEVIQEYEPELKPVTKTELAPDLPPPPANRVQQEYQVPQQTLYYSYRALPLRPLALGTADTAPEAPMNYALLGVGNLSTILGEVGIGSLKGKNWQTALQARYITQQGDPNDQVFRSFHLNGTGSLTDASHTYEAAITAQRDVFGAYGYNHDVIDYDFDAVRRALSGGSLKLGMLNNRTGPWGLDYHPTIGFSYYKASTWNSEQSINIELPASKRIDSNWSVGLAVDARLTTSDIDTNGWNNNIIQIRPAVNYESAKYGFRAGLYPTIGKVTYLLPDLEFHYNLKTHVVLSAGMKSTLQQNTLRELTVMNPYYKPGGVWSQSRVDDIYGNLSFALGRHLNIFGGVGFKQWKDLPLFVTVPSGDGKDFDVIIDPHISAINWTGGLRYALGEDFIASAEVNWLNFTDSGYPRVWGMPALRFRGKMDWKPIANLRVGAYVEVMDQIWGRDVQGNEVSLKGVVDLGASAEYTIIRKLDLFLRAENILDRSNERWLGYPSFGFNIYGGLRFRF